MNEEKSWHELAEAGEYEKLVAAIDAKKFDPGTLLDKDGYTVWHHLGYGGHYDKLKLAISEKRFPADFALQSGYTVWHSLAAGGHYDKLKQAIKDKKFDPKTTKYSDGFTVWHQLAVCGHHAQIAQAISDKSFDPSTTISTQGYTVFAILLEFGHKVAHLELQQKDQEIAHLKDLAAALQGGNSKYALKPETPGQSPVSYLPLFARSKKDDVETSSSSDQPQKRVRMAEPT